MFVKKFRVVIFVVNKSTSNYKHFLKSQTKYVNSSGSSNLFYPRFTDSAIANLFFCLKLRLNFTNLVVASLGIVSFLFVFCALPLSKNVNNDDKDEHIKFDTLSRGL